MEGRMKPFNEVMDELAAKDVEVSFRDHSGNPHYRYFKRRTNAEKFALKLNRNEFWDVVITEEVQA
jgi:hypothetical protein